MKLLLILALVAAAFAAPQEQQYTQTEQQYPQTEQQYPQTEQKNHQEAQIVRYEVNNGGLDAYNFVYELTDGTKHEEQGQLKNQGTENEGISVTGQYSWMGPDGVLYTVTYTADENGYRPQIEQGPGGSVPSAVIASLLG